MTDKNSLDSLGALIRQLREARGWSQGHLGKLLDCSQKTVSTYENGTEPQVSVLRSLAEIFGVTTDFLLGLSKHPTVLPTDWWLVDDGHIDALLKAKDSSQLKPLQDPDGGITIGFPIPQRPRLVSSSDYKSLRDRVEAAVRVARRSRKGTES
jgi:transcriptional regulator with XRE-family HTH domain